MRTFLCTITFRHHLVSIDELAVFARTNGFDGLELWGAHARNLGQRGRGVADRLDGLGLAVPMISDYLPLGGDAADLEAATLDLCRLAAIWRAGRIRTFAGDRASAATTLPERRRITERLRSVCRIAGDHGVQLLVETHPDTLADCGASIRALLADVDHPALKLNFDTLHVWEGGDDPAELHAALRPHIAHYHLKNVRARADLGVFAAANVYAASGRRDGMVPLFEGAFDYPRFLASTLPADADVSLEWFGGQCFAVLKADRQRLTAFGARPVEHARSA
ncbi:sugar phosphate isomerase/epimerase family protein [Methylobrevis albus]|uniref:Sugar phosphate isomerase/epimerase n=1 Tax=Methylobrevis albus TaxID=2793297 RepID=A0A931HZB4_9HYPH|nr:sugar phosphate isomerase/epimerase family protein [Methylobrevis albus]MBH0236459.1 sugar phosphate isomerase/epimerase [Methylobrevis albus]